MTDLRTIFSLLLFLPLSISAQNNSGEKTTIEIIRADVLNYKEKGGKEIKKLKGNVRLKHEGTYMDCDSALLYDNENKVDASGNIHIQQGDTINAYAKELLYLGNTNSATLSKNVRLTNRQMELTTDRLIYQTDQNLSYYKQGGTLTDAENTLTSEHGYYHMDNNDVYFKHDVKLVNPDYTITCDTLKYNTNSEIVYFLGPSTITSDENVITCRYGWYDTQKDISQFSNEARINSSGYIIKGDTLYYDRNQQFGRAIGNMRWVDSSGSPIITGERGLYYEDEKSALVTENPLLINVEDSDSLFLAADTLHTLMHTDTSNTDTSRYRMFHAYYNVRMFKENFQARADSLKYSFHDSTFWLYRNPILWTEGNQMTGDTITTHIKNGSIHRLSLHRSAFLINELDSPLFNQISGRNIFGFFENDTLQKLKVRGNGKSIYYATDDSNAYIGANKATSSHLLLRFKNNQVNEVVFQKSPRAVLHPMRDVDPTEFRLEGFTWREDLRPKSKAELRARDPALLKKDTVPK